MGWVVVLLMVVICWQLSRISHQLDRSAVLAATIKIHLREAKEEHWAQLNAIRSIVLAQATASGQIPRERLDILADTPEKVDRWAYNMPSDYLEVDWNHYLADHHRDKHWQEGQSEAYERLVKEAGLRRRT
jgi:hypothetical protein